MDGTPSGIALLVFGQGVGADVGAGGAGIRAASLGAYSRPHFGRSISTPALPSTVPVATARFVRAVS